MPDFGWSLPPGAAGHPSAPWNQPDMPCEVCGLEVDRCICPECPVCEEQGNPLCYDGAVKCSWCGTVPSTKPATCSFCNAPDAQLHKLTPITQDNLPSHGLVRTQAQIDSLATQQAQWAESARAEAEWEAQHIAEQDKWAKELEKYGNSE